MIPIDTPPFYASTAMNNKWLRWYISPNLGQQPKGLIHQGTQDAFPGQ